MGLDDLWKSVKDAAARAAAEAQAKAAREAVSKAADAALDDLETALLGKAGAADEILAREAEKDPLAEARKRWGTGDAAAPPPTDRAREVADREARARAELAELKRKMNKG